MKTIKQILLGSLILVIMTGCAYRYFLGMHGPSMLNFSGIHEGVTEDSECLKCHHPDRDSAGPPTSHPQFTGCLKCHNDPLK
jgi:hypothetical protein